MPSVTQLMNLSKRILIPAGPSEAEATKPRTAVRGKLYIDISPMQEAEYTGIPHVAAKLCEELLGDRTMEPAFFYNRHQVPIEIVEHLLKMRSGSMLRWAAAKFAFRPLLDPRSREYDTYGLHTNMKFARRMFPIEGQIVHDLTTIVTPQHHTPGTNEYHQTKFYGDLMSNDITFAVSQSTATDLRTYYPGVAKRDLVVAYLGVDWTHIDQRARDLDFEAERFVLVLGTIEPRKNIGIVLDLLKRNPQFARTYRIVIGGRIGWGTKFEKEIEDRGLKPLLENGRILQTGFVSETAKYLLFRNAAAVVYPSTYEGFGLPVAEAVSLGAPIVTTPSSSIPEVGRDFAYYFSSGDVGSLEEALNAAIRQKRVMVSRSGETLDSWSQRFSWNRCYTTIRDGFLRLNPPAHSSGMQDVHRHA